MTSLGSSGSGSLFKSLSSCHQGVMPQASENLTLRVLLLRGLTHMAGGRRSQFLVVYL